MDFIACLQEQLRLHPAMQPRDVLKLCYQAARGAEHLLADTTRARAYFDQEYAATPVDATLPLLEIIGPEVARVNIAAWKAAGLPAAWLFRMFVRTASVAADRFIVSSCSISTIDDYFCTFKHGIELFKIIKYYSIYFDYIAVKLTSRCRSKLPYTKM